MRVSKKVVLFACMMSLFSLSGFAGETSYTGRCANSGALFIVKLSNEISALEAAASFKAVCKGSDVIVARPIEQVDNRANLNKLLTSRGLKTLEQLEVESNAKAAEKAAFIADLMKSRAERPLGITFTRNGVKTFISQEEMASGKTASSEIEVVASSSAQ